MSKQYYFVERLKIVENQLCKLNPSYGKVSHALKLVQLPAATQPLATFSM